MAFDTLLHPPSMCCQRDTPPATRHQYVTAIRDTVDELVPGITVD